MNRIVILYLLLAFLFACKNDENKKNIPTAVKGVIDLREWDFQKDGMIAFEGEWEFYWNELIENPEEQKNFFKHYDPSKIQYIPVPSEWQNLEVNGNKLPVDGYAMYRLRVLLPTRDIPLSFSMTDICSAYAVYINGVYHFSRGKIAKTKDETIPILQYGTFPLKENTKELEIVFLITNFHHGKAGFWNKLTIGSEKQIEDFIKKTLVLDYFTFGALVIMGFYHLILYALRPKDKSPFYFGLFCIILSLRILAMEERPLMEMIPILPFLTVYKFEYITIYFALPIFMLFVNSLFPKEFSKFFLKLNLTICFSATAIVCFFPPKVYTTWLLLIIQILMLFSIVYSEYVLIIAIIRKRMGAVAFLLGTFIFYIALVNDILYGMNLIHTIHAATFGFLAFIFSQSIILSIRFSNAFTMSENLTVELKEKSDSLFVSNIELNNLKEGLEIKVEERTKKLEEAYQKNLKEEQKVAKLRAEIFTIQERENLFYDIHDHIKGDVSELGLLLEKIKTYQVPIDISNQAEFLLKRVAASVKNRMLMLEDKQLLEEDFSNGLQMSLLRRYTALNRRFIFEITEFAESKLALTTTEFKNSFYSITTEISNNDLKYGFGDSVWKITFLDSNEILLEMKSNSNYHGSTDTGKGQIGISRKLDLIGGSVEEEIKDGLYLIWIRVPLSS